MTHVDHLDKELLAAAHVGLFLTDSRLRRTLSKVSCYFGESKQHGMGLSH